MIRIIEAEKIMLPKAEKLIKEVFPWMDISEKMSFWMFRNRNSLLARAIMRLGGLSALSGMWIAVNEAGDVCGTTGFYTCTKDEDEAYWLSWFCVCPTQRGQGLGKRLLEFSIDKARADGKKFLRLYTSDDDNEAEAQGLYEKYGFVVTKEEKLKYYTLIYREKRL